jgi:hypothetical protein
LKMPPFCATRSKLIRDAPRLQQVDLKIRGRQLRRIRPRRRRAEPAVLPYSIFATDCLCQQIIIIFKRARFGTSAHAVTTATPSCSSIISRKTGTYRRTLLLPGEKGFRSRGCYCRSGSQRRVVERARYRAGSRSSERDAASHGNGRKKRNAAPGSEK